MKKHIGITNPCSEDRSKMTPTEAGVFCQKCAMEVYDFSHLSDVEIRQTLLSKLGQSVCARITNKQEDRLIQAFYDWQSSRQRHLQKAMLFSLIAVFGLTLFSCTSPKEEASLVDFQRTIQQSVLQTPTDDAKEVVITSAETQVTPVRSEPIHVQAIKKEKRVVVQAEMTDVATEFEERYFQYDGGMSWSSDYELYLLEETDLTYETRLPEEMPHEKLELKVFPNPTIELATLEVHGPDNAENQVIHLIDMQGQTLDVIYDGPAQKGRQSFPVNVAHYPPGIYLIVVITDDKKEIVRLMRS